MIYESLNNIKKVDTLLKNKRVVKIEQHNDKKLVIYCEKFTLNIVMNEEKSFEYFLEKN